MKTNLALIFALICPPLLAAEVDHYSLSADRIPDALETVNERANLHLKKALRTLNQKGSCDEASSEKKLYKELRRYFANHTKGQFSIDLLHDKGIPKAIIPLGESVYQDWSIFNGFLLGRRSAKKSPLALGPIMRTGPYTLGTDKFEHMFGMGFQYFKGHHLKDRPLHKVLKRGIMLEKTALGGNIFATGIFSYGDLAANFNGMRFWNHMLQKYDDVLGSEYNIGPYIRCDSGKWTAVKKINFLNYIDESMDESVNCSKFATAKGVRKFTSRMGKKIQKQCLSETKDRYEHLKKRYDVVISGDKKQRPISHWILNTEGHDKVSYFNEF